MLCSESAGPIILALDNHVLAFYLFSCYTNTLKHTLFFVECMVNEHAFISLLPPIKHDNLH
jgi:hypothetical protein